MTLYQDTIASWMLGGIVDVGAEVYYGSRVVNGPSCNIQPIACIVDKGTIIFLEAYVGD